MPLTLKVSPTGSVELPEAVIEATGWEPGTELEVVSDRAQIVVRARRDMSSDLQRDPISIEEFVKRVPRYEGPSITQEMMDQAVLDEARRRWHAKNR